MDNHEISTAPFSDLLKTYRKRKKITQRHLAEKLGVHYNTVWAWECGDHLPETKGMVLELAKHLRLDTQETRALLEASLTAVSPYWHVPYQHNRFFSGREELLVNLHTLLGQGQTTSLAQAVALTGLGGVGKTHIALEYAYRHMHTYAATFWIEAETADSFLGSFSAIAGILQVSRGAEADQQKVVTSITQWLATHRDWLLIVDNLEDIELIKRFLSPTRHGSLLFTARMHTLGSLAHALEIPPMGRTEGTSFLLQRSGHLHATDPLADEGSAREIVALMGGLPLALDQAGAYIEETKCSLTDYLQLLSSSQRQLLDERGIHADHPFSVTRSFTLAFEHLERISVLAAELLTACAFLSAEAIPETLFLAGASSLGPTFEVLAADAFVFQATMKLLLSYSLLQRDPITRTITVHRLVQAVLKERLAERVQQRWISRIIKALTALFPVEEGQADYWSFGERLLPHALVALKLGACLEKEKSEVIPLMNAVATYLTRRARFAEAEELYQQACSLAEQSLLPESPLLAELLHGLACLYGAQGRYDEAEPLHTRALSLAEQAPGQDHLLVADISYWLAVLYASQGKYPEAEPHFLQACTLRERLLPQGHPLMIEALGGLARFTFLQGKYARAEALYQRAISLCESALGPEHTRVATLLNNLAELYLEQDQQQQAEPLLQRALCIWEQAFGPEHPYLAHPLHGLATIARRQGRYDEAEQRYQRALTIKEKAVGQDHPDSASLLYELADLSWQRGAYEQAAVSHRRTLALRQHHLGQDHPDVADSFHALARIQERHSSIEALTLYQQALAIREKTLGPEHPKTLETRIAYMALLTR